MRYQSVLALLAVSAAYAAPIADADAVAVADADYSKPAPKPYGYEPEPETYNPATVLSDAAIALIKWKLALLKAGAKIVLSPFEAAYAAAHDLKPEYPAPGKTYARDAEADYSKPAPKPYKGEEGPLDAISDAALALLKFKLYLIETGAKIILSPFEQAYADKYHPAPSYPAPKSYPRDAEVDYSKPAPKPYSGSEVNPLEVISDAALAVLKFKLYLIETGAKIILSPFEKAYTDKYHPAPSYPAPKSYPRDAEADYAPKKADLGEELSEAAIDVLKFKLYLISTGAKIILSPLEAAYNEKHHPAPYKGYY